MKRIMRIIIMLLAITFIFILAYGIHFIGMTTPGLKVALKYSTHLLPGKLYVEEAKGKLFSDFTLKNISYTDTKKQIYIKQLHVSWVPKFLLRNQIVLNHLSLNHARINFEEKSQSSNPFLLSELSWANKIVIKKAEIQDVSINANVNGLPIKGKINVIFNNNQFEISHTQFLIAGSTINLSGAGYDRCDLQGNIILPKMGITLDKINLIIHHKKNNILFNGGFESGKGDAQMEGNLNLSNLDLKIHLLGKNLQLINLPDYKVNLTPDIILTINPSDINLQGEFEVPDAEIIANHFSDIATLSNDVIIEGTKESPDSFNLLRNVTMDLRIKLGDQVKLIYGDLTTTLEGHLLLTQQLGSAPIASGQLSAVKGTYTTHGQILDIQKGSRLLFAGSTLTNPGLDIRAIKRIKRAAMNHASLFSNQMQPTYTGTESITLGVQLNGTFNQPAISLFSAPGDLSQADILSYLLFGKPQSQVTEAPMLALLSSAASSMINSNAAHSKTTQKIQRWLSKIDIDTQTTGTMDLKTNSLTTSTTFGIGKQLARNLYLHYSVGNGIDLMYGFEFN